MTDERLVIVPIVLFLGLLLGVALAQGKTQSAEAPHFNAIRLVMESRAAEVLSVDPADQWWHDTKARTWSARRPVGPGVIDSTNWIEVTYSIDGQVVRTWNVNTKTGQVAGPDEEFRIE